MRRTGHDTGDGEESLPIGNSSSSQATEKTEMSMEGRDRNLGWANQEKLPEKEIYGMQDMGSQEQKSMPLGGGVKPTPSQKPPSPSALINLRLIWCICVLFFTAS